ncbi:hypothetical protein BpHYR1_047860 [Brachionus plicatilis]|uniref:Uncharacterized protein n=1 Tax=Brachionus plicatilis TaxID=10195 RepID=A0A3M7PTW2_BRAPC|nr:hypothetical protein BpHYR1_047860 [Brachionus plicatilis]
MQCSFTKFDDIKERFFLLFFKFNFIVQTCFCRPLVKNGNFYFMVWGYFDNLDFFICHYKLCVYKVLGTGEKKIRKYYLHSFFYFENFSYICSPMRTYLIYTRFCIRSDCCLIMVTNYERVKQAQFVQEQSKQNKEKYFQLELIKIYKKYVESVERAIAERIEGFTDSDIKNQIEGILTFKKKKQGDITINP